MDQSAKVFETDETSLSQTTDDNASGKPPCSVELIEIHETEQLAREAEGHYTELARSVESEPCEIISDIGGVKEGFKLMISFNFCNESEKENFLRKLH